MTTETAAASLLMLMGDAGSQTEGGECYIKSAERPALRTMVRGGLATVVRTERLGGKRTAVARLTGAGWRAYWGLNGLADPR